MEKEEIRKFYNCLKISNFLTTQNGKFSTKPIRKAIVLSFPNVFV